MIDVEFTDRTLLYHKKYPVLKLQCQTPLSLNCGKRVQNILSEDEIVLASLPEGKIYKCEARDFVITYRPVCAKKELFLKTSWVQAKRLERDIVYYSDNGSMQNAKKRDYPMRNIVSQRAYIVAKSSFEKLYRRGKPVPFILNDLIKHAIDKDVIKNDKSLINADQLYPATVLQQQPLFHKIIKVHISYLK